MISTLQIRGSWIPSPGGHTAWGTSDPVTQPDDDVSQLDGGSTAQRVKDDPGMPRLCHAAIGSSDEHLTDLIRSQKDLDGYLIHVFQHPVLFLGGPRAIDDTVARTLQIINPPTRAKIRRLAEVVCTHWARAQFRREDANVGAPQIVALISRIAGYLRGLSVHAEMDFLNALRDTCTENVRLAWRWYVDIVMRGISHKQRKNLFVRVMAVIAMTSHLFRGDQLRYDVALDGLEFIATMSPWPDAVALIYVFVQELGPKFALEQAGWDFTQRILAQLLPLTQHCYHAHPVSQLVRAMDTLVTEWHNKTRVTLYQTNPQVNN